MAAADPKQASEFSQPIKLPVAAEWGVAFTRPPAIGKLNGGVMVSSLVFRIDGRFGTGWQLISFWGGLLALVSVPGIRGELVPD